MTWETDEWDEPLRQLRDNAAAATDLHAKIALAEIRGRTRADQEEMEAEFLDCMYRNKCDAENAYQLIGEQLGQVSRKGEAGI